MANKNYYMYVLLCSDGTFYGGFTNNVYRRLAVHQAGKGAKYTKTRRPLKLLYFEEFADKSTALKAEYAFKHQSRSKKETFLINHGISPSLWGN
ncbi:GIY-YIG nuclease family protein [Fructilactobacillus fructivorans]|uniref:GIY-YIG nuclease family protein n=1 Tax=Fructilactobacillus fructivorans TaxID=1614 RepID=A0AAE6P0H8_9LACO|nr:GIY-YIG nuclease family protein [Fructilactobacillus fructivorans]QFX92749.1 GIY-YIG nuclease family protein [Fructilactobacillus fructivorans]RDV65658.1 GIY-YIG nuclease family protein [Fructilactobacillus fructivorans]